MNPEETAVIRQVDAQATHPLRLALLRPTQQLSEMAYPGDDTATHFGAFMSDDLVGIASIYPSDDGSWRLRAMAVSPTHRGRGVGSQLLAACVEHCNGQDAFELWCNARTPAMVFYARAGFVSEGEEFEVAHAGPHFVMRLTLV